MIFLKNLRQKNKFYLENKFKVQFQITNQIHQKKKNFQPTQSDIHLKMQKTEENFIMACQFGIQEIIDENLNDSFSLNYVNYFGQTPLMISIIANKPEIAQKLLKSNLIKIDQKTHLENKTHLMYACEKGYSGIIQTLLSKGARADDCDSQGRTALHYAIMNKLFGVAQVLIRSDSNIINIQDVEGRTALHYALSQKVVEKSIVNLLLNAGAKDLEDIFLKKPSDLASKELQSEILLILEKKL